jgi:TctA family transporter
MIGVFLGLLLGAVPGFWFGARQQERAKGHWVLGAMVAVFALGGLGMYTFGGPSSELFTRLVTLPLTLVIAVAAAAILIGVPMYAGYVSGHRLGAWVMRDR